MTLLVGGEIVLGGLAGTVIAELYKCIKSLGQISETYISFEAQLRHLECTRESLKPLINEITEYNTNMKLTPYAETRELEIDMKKAMELVDKCSTAGDWKQLINSTKLDTLLKSLTSRLNEAQRARDQKETLHLTRATNKTISEWFGFSTATHSRDDEGMQDISSMPQIKIEASSSLPVGLDVPLKELKMKLLTDDEVPIHVLTGLGGCGKTTLAKQFYEDNEVKGKFKNNILVITVLESSKLELECILNILDMNLDFSYPASLEAVSEIMKNKGETPVLLVLDDIWSESEFILENLNALKMPNWKILVTSRFEFQNFENCRYYINILNDEDAMTLFLDSASKGAQGGSYVSEYLVKQIVGHLKGLPLALKVVGTSFGNMSLKKWHERLKAWFAGSLVLDFESKELLRCLQRSFDDMHGTSESLIKECFISLASFPKGQRIPVVALIDMWPQDLDNQLLLNYHESIIPKLQELTKRNLANLVPTRSGTWDTDGYYSEHFIIQHDMLRELSIYQLTCEENPMNQNKSLIIDIVENNLPEWWKKLNHDQPIQARLLSISTDSVFSTKWPNMEVPDIEILILNFQTKSYAMPKFVKKMKKLRVLLITNYGVSNAAELSYFEVLSSLLKLRRIRLDHISFPSIFKNSLVLENLHKLSLFMCKVGQAFRDCSSPYPFPNLVELNIDYCIDLEELSMVVHLIHLKTLSISNCHKLSALPESIEKLVHLQVLRLRSCTGLENLPDSVTKLQELILLDISDCCSLTELPENIGDLRSLLKLNMRQCSRLQDLPDSVGNLEKLQVVICDCDELVMLWREKLPDVPGRSIMVVKEDFNLNWLAKPLSSNNDVVARMNKEEMKESAPKFNTVIVKLQELKGELQELKVEQDAVKGELSSMNHKLDGITNLLSELVGVKKIEAIDEGAI